MCSYHLKTILENILPFRLDDCLCEGKTFQNRSVSSPAPVTIVYPLGFIARNRTLLVWPVSVVIFSSVGYFHTTISLLEYPCVLTNYFVVFENMRLHIWDPVSMLSKSVPSSVFQNLIVLSADPPPEAKTPWLWGFHASPFTAAECWLNLLTGTTECVFHIMSLLSFPPDASDWPSNDHFSPHTSCVCPW